MSLVTTAALNRAGDAGLQWLAGVIKCALLDTSTFTPAAGDTFLSGIPVANRSAGSGALTTKTIVGGVLDADDALIPSVGAFGTGQTTAEAVVIYQEVNAADDTVNPIIGYVDRDAGGAVLSFAVNGGDVQVVWPTNGILSLASV